MTIESIADKYPMSLVGKLHALAAGLSAERVVYELPDVKAAQCCLDSRFGDPVSMGRWSVESKDRFPSIRVRWR